MTKKPKEPADTLQVLSDLAAKMEAAPNPWTVLEAEGALSLIAGLWQAAQKDRDAAECLARFLRPLSPPRPKGRPPVSPETKAERARTAATIASLTAGILAGNIRLPSSPEEMLEAIDADPATLSHEQRRDLYLALGQFLEMEETKLLLLPPPTGGEAQKKGKARNRARRFLAATARLAQRHPPGPDFSAIWYLIEDWRTGTTPVVTTRQGKRMKVPSSRDVFRKRLRRAGKGPPTGT